MTIRPFNGITLWAVPRFRRPPPPLGQSNQFATVVYQPLLPQETTALPEPATLRGTGDNITFTQRKT